MPDNQTTAPMLRRMEDGRIFAIERKGDDFNIYECCDQYFEETITPAELRLLGEEIIQLSETATDGR